MNLLEWEGKEYVPELVTPEHPDFGKVWYMNGPRSPKYTLRGTHGAKYWMIPYPSADGSEVLRVVNANGMGGNFQAHTPFGGAAFTEVAPGQFKYTHRFGKRFRSRKAVKTNAV